MMQANLYFFQGSQALGSSVQRGSVISLVYDYEPEKNLGLLAEFGFSRGIAAAGKFHFEGAQDQLSGSLRYEPIHFASIGANNMHGFYSTFDWTRELTPRLTYAFSFTGNHYNLPSLNMSDTVANLDTRFLVSLHWSLASGMNYGRSQSHLPLEPTVSSSGIPLGLNFDSPHFQSSFLYQYSKTSGTIMHSDDFRATLGTQWSNLRWNGFVDRQTQTPAISFLAGTPDLQQAIDKLGIAATTPAQIAFTLNQTAGLLNQGLIEAINIHVIPVRLQAGSDLAWCSHDGSRQILDLSLLYNNNESTDGEVRTMIATFSYSAKFKKSYEFLSSVSLLHESRGGPGTPQVEVSIRRQIGGGTKFLLPGRHGTIEGIVFADDGAIGAYHAGALPLPDVEVILDDTRHVNTDRFGRYRFTGLPYGSHSVEAVYHSATPYFFTTASRAQSEVNAEVNFGVAMSLARLLGFVRSDMGIGLPGIELNISNGSQQLRAITDSQGKFQVDGLSSGDYQIKVNTDSVPPGYSLSGLKARRMTMDPLVPAQCEFTLDAIRNISGRVTIYDRVLQREAPLARIEVLLQELSLKSVTDDNGIYLFRNLPARSYHLQVLYRDKESTTQVTLPNEPAFPKAVDIHILTK